MDLASLLLFATALFVAAATPGPGIAAIVARVLGRGPRGAVAFSAGVAVGDVVWLTVAVLGLAAVAQTFHALFLVIKYAGCAYLAWLGWKLWTAPVVARADENALPQEGGVRLFLAGLAVTMGNPKVVVFYLALLPTLVDLKRVTVLGFAELAGVTLAVLGLVFSAYIVLAARARLLFTSERAMRAVNKTTGAVMVGAAATIAAR